MAVDIPDRHSPVNRLARAIIANLIVLRLSKLNTPLVINVGHRSPRSISGFRFLVLRNGLIWIALLKLYAIPLTREDSIHEALSDLHVAIVIDTNFPDKIWSFKLGELERHAFGNKIRQFEKCRIACNNMSAFRCARS